MRLPVNNSVITSKYGNRKLNGADNWHPGWDLVDSVPGSENALVYAVADGTVCFDFDKYNAKERWNPSSNSSGGNFIIINHKIKGIEYFCRYFHLIENYVSDRQPIKEGQVIGRYADVGLSYGPHLHFDICTVWGKWGTVDPANLFGKIK